MTEGFISTLLLKAAVLASFIAAAWGPILMLVGAALLVRRVKTGKWQ